MSRDVMADADEAVSLQDQAFVIDPLRDSRWPTLVEQHPAASVFHSRPWLQALQVTYGFEPIAVTTSQPSEPLRNALVFCIVRSWLTGHRLVSLPFSDHCEPLVAGADEFNVLMRFVEALRKGQDWKYVQVRSTNTTLSFEGYFNEAEIYCVHRLDLRPDLDILHRRLHKDCLQRKIQRAEREGVRYKAGRSESLLAQLYGLVRVTRARQRLPPQPIEWFRNLVACMGANVCIRMAFQEDRPVAGILTLNQGRQVVYKYGASDPNRTYLGGTPMLLWEAIKQAKQDGAGSFDFGRSDLDNPGLITFKERWGAERDRLVMWESPGPISSLPRRRQTMEYAKGLLGWLPSSVQTMAGRLLYRHIG